MQIAESGPLTCAAAVRYERRTIVWDLASAWQLSASRGPEFTKIVPA